MTLPPVLVDPRKGSGDACREGKVCGKDCLKPSLLQLGIPTEHQYLEYGDVQIIGRGPEDRPVLIGIEIKAIGDLLQCIVDKRFATNQLRGMLDTYEVRYLLVEGILTAAPNLELMEWDGKKMVKASRGTKRWDYPAVRGWIRTMTRAGMIEAGSPDRRGTAAWIAAEYNWWKVPYDEHNSHVDVSLKSLEEESNGNAIDALVVPEITRKMLVAASLAYGVGRAKAQAIAAYFRSIKQMINAPEEEWINVDGIGSNLAGRIVGEINKEE